MPSKKKHLTPEERQSYLVGKIKFERLNPTEFKPGKFFIKRDGVVCAMVERKLMTLSEIRKIWPAEADKLQIQVKVFSEAS